MRWDKIVARILLIFSVVNVALAAPVRGRHLNVADASSEKREGSDDEAPDGSGSEPMPELVSSSGTSEPGSEPMPELVSSSGASESGSEPMSEPVSDSGTSHYMSASVMSHYLSSSGSSRNSPEPPLLSSSSHQSSSSDGDITWELFSDEEEDDEWPEDEEYEDSPEHAEPEWGEDPPSEVSYHDSAPLSPSGSSRQNSASGSSQLDLPPKSTFLNDALKKKLKIFGALGTAAGISAGIIYGVQKEVKGTRSPVEYVFALTPLSPANF